MKKSILLSMVVSGLLVGTSALYAADLDVAGTVNVTADPMPIGPTRTAYPAINMMAAGDTSVSWILGTGTETDEPGINAVGFINPATGAGPLFIVSDAVSDLLLLSQDSVAVNSVDLDDTVLGTANLIVGGDILATFTGENVTGDGLSSLATLSADNNASGQVSDAGFRLENAKVGFQWDFRTLETAEGFAATKLGTGGPEFRVDNPTSDYQNAKVSMGGVVIFENGALVTTPSSSALKTNIKDLETKAAMKAFHQLKPVTFAYKTRLHEPVVGFIAEDVPELVAVEGRKSIHAAEILAVLTKVVQGQDKALTETRTELKKAQEKIAELEVMQKRLTKVESLLTNLALDTSKTAKEKISLK